MTQDKALQLFHYDPETGSFTCRNKGQFKIAKYRVTGWEHSTYLAVQGLNPNTPRKSTPVVRLIWLMQTGQWLLPKWFAYQDGDHHNLKWSNLFLEKTLREVVRKPRRQSNAKRQKIHPIDYFTGALPPSYARSSS